MPTVLNQCAGRNRAGLRLVSTVMTALVALLLVSRTTPTEVLAAPAAGENQVRNGSFEGGSTSWSEPWGFSGGPVGSARGTLGRDGGYEGSATARVDVASADAAHPWYVQLYQSGLAVNAGTTATVTFVARADRTRTLGVAVSGTNFYQPAVALGTGWQQYSYTFTATTTTAAILAFNFAQQPGSVWLDSVFFAIGGSVPTPTPVPTPAPTPTATPAPTPTGAPAGGNQVRNNSFEGGSTSWSSPWAFVDGSGGSARGTLARDGGYEGSASARVDVITADYHHPWYVQLYQGGLNVTAGTPVTITFVARADRTRTLGVAVSGTNFYQPAVALTSGWRQYSYSFTPGSSGAAALVFNLAQEPGSVWLDSVFFAIGGSAPVSTPVPTPAPTPTAPPTPTPTPGSGSSIYLGVTQHPAPWDMNALTQFEDNSGREAAIVSYFVGFQANNPPERHRLQAVAARGAMPMITWEWWQISNLGEVVSGRYDADARLWARELKSYGGPVLLRWGHEMNLTNYRWSVGVHGNTAQQYVEAWRRLRDIFRQEGATNVQWVWSPNIRGNGVPDFTPMFPGDADVDWVALDGYNWSTPVPWLSFTQLFRDSYNAITALSSRWLMIAEWGSAEQGGDKGAWLRSALQTEIPSSFPRIKAVVYFNQQYDGKDWRIESSENARRGYADGVASPIYRSSWP
jgi:hypothetical protein